MTISDVAFPAAAEPVYLGFDRNDFPGLEAMAKLRQAGFQFTSFWLAQGPNADPNAPWTPALQELRNAGWGFLVLFWGRQAVKANGKQQGTEDGAQAVRLAKGSFAPRTVIFLDVEDGGRLDPEYVTYVEAWAAAVRRSGFAPGVYCSAHGTAAQLHQNAATRNLVFWVYQERHCPSPGCVAPDPLPHPALSGFPHAAIWQYARSPRYVENEPASGKLGYDRRNVEEKDETGRTVIVTRDMCFARLDGEIIRDANGREVHVDLNVSTYRDPSGGLEEPNLWTPLLVIISAIWRWFGGLLAIDLAAIFDFGGQRRVNTPSVGEHVEKYVAEIRARPGRGYLAPTAAEACTMATAFTLVAAGDTKRALTLLRAFEYRVLTGVVNGRPYFVLHPGTGRCRSWGLYFFCAAGEGETIVEIPHPVSDRETERMGVAAFVQGGARALFVAGTRRNAATGADVAHDRPSVFQAIHERAVDDLAGRTAQLPKVVQFHGFGRECHPGCTGAFVSAGKVGSFAEEIGRVVEALRRVGGFHADFYREGSPCAKPSTCPGSDPLGATTNLQGVYCRDHNATFVHVEVDESLRSQPEVRDRIATTVVHALDMVPGV